MKREVARLWFQHLVVMAWAAFLAWLAIRNFRQGVDGLAAIFAVGAIESACRSAIDNREATP